MTLRPRHLLIPTVALGLLGGGRMAVAPMLAPALGFAAKVTCSGVFVGGATEEQVRTGFPDERLREIVRLRVDSAAGSVEALIPWLGRRVARHRPGFGCTLEPRNGPLGAVPAQVQDVPWPTGRDTLPWPEGERMPAAAVAGMDTAGLRAVLEAAFLEPGGGPARRTHAVVVVHRGRLVAERYADGYSPAHRFPGWSMAKSVTAALTGILVGDGRIELDADSLRPEWIGPGDPRATITLRQLLHMSSGLAFDERYTPTGGATRMLFDAGDVSAVAAGSQLETEPGTHWQYSSATTNLIASYLRDRLPGDQRDYLEFPARRLFRPIGMRSAVLEPDASGTFVGSSFMYATARDWARFGLLHLRDGVWNGRRVLPAGWVAFSVTPAPAAPLGRYGAQWWLNAGEPADPQRRPWPELPADLYWASGFQGQYVAVIPSRDLVVVRLGLSETEEAFPLGEFLRGVLGTIP